MNLSEALDAALPEIPRTRLARKNPPCLDPDLVIREDESDGEPIFSIYQRSTANLLRLKPTQWQLAQMFDGVRSYEEIASAFEAETKIPLSADEARTFAENMEETGFWYKNPQEKNLAMIEKLAAQRSRRAQNGSFNVAHIQFSAWDPDRYLTWLDKRIGKYVYNRWMVLAAVLLFLFQAIVFVVQWNVIRPDITTYFDFSRKTFSDLVEFWVLLVVIGFVHESSHGLTCKHYGGGVHSMGLLFLYLTPAFYVDITEAWVSTGRLQRMATIIAGIWTEMLLCGIAILIWTNTQPGAWIHDLCYKVILLTGLAVVAVNINPLIKLDGYYFFTEWLRIPDLKERSTGFLVGWIQRHVFRLPVEVPVISRRRVPLFVIYALASGAYSYLLLLVFVRFSYNVLFHWLAELAVIPAAALAFFIFRSRLRSLGAFVMVFFRAKQEAGAFRLTLLHGVFGIALLAVLFVPILRDRANGYFVVESEETHQIRAGVPGRVSAVYVKEGDAVRRGQIMATMQSINAASANAEARAKIASSQAEVFAAQLQHSGLGEALVEQQAAHRSSALAREETTRLSLTAPETGVISTPEPENLVNRDVTTGQAVLTVIDPTRLVARLYIPASEMARIRSGDRVSLELSSRFTPLHGKLGSMEGSAVQLPVGLLPEQQYRGTALPVFFTTRMPLGATDDTIRTGMSGEAKIFGRRRSIALRVTTAVGNVLRTHFW
jgi:putative peptide zinc metalloprotease protein